MNGPNATYAPAPVRSARSLSWVGPAIVILFAAVLMAAAAQLVREPDTVAKVQIVNPIESAVDVDVMQPGGPWLPLAVVEPQSTTTAYDVVDGFIRSGATVRQLAPSGPVTYGEVLPQLGIQANAPARGHRERHRITI